MTEDPPGGTEAWPGIPYDHVVAVLAQLDNGRVQIGSGYLVTGRKVLTALHCIQDNKTGRPARSLRVIRPSDGAEAPATLNAAVPDIAVLDVEEDPAWSPTLLEPPKFGRVDRTRAMELNDCQAIGFPAWQLDPSDQQRNPAELHGTIRVIDDVGSGFLLMRDTSLPDVAIPDSAPTEDRGNSPWGGLSGALVFYRGHALGVIVQHHPRQGGSALRITPVERLAVSLTDASPEITSDEEFAASSAEAGSAAASLAAVLALPPADELPVVNVVGIRPDAPSAPGTGSPGSGPEPGGRITLDVIMRGPLQALNLTGRFEEAEGLERTDPSSAGPVFAELADRLSAEGFTPHADAMRHRAVEAYGTAGDRADAIRIRLAMVNETMIAGEWGQVAGRVLVMNELLQAPDGTLSAGLTEAVAALQVIVALLEDPVLPEANLAPAVAGVMARLDAVLGQLVTDLADFTLLLRTAAIVAAMVTEIAIAAEAPSVMTASVGLLDRLADALASDSDPLYTHLRTRLRLAAAEIGEAVAGHSDRWTQLRQDVDRQNLRGKDAALIFARYARAKAVDAMPADADAAWRRAIEFGVQAQLFSDSAGWLSAQWQLRHRYGPIDVQEIQDLRQMIQLLAEQSSDRLVPAEDARLECLEALRRGDQGLRSAALAGQRLRILAASVGLWQEELQAHSLLADIFDRSGEPSLAAAHRIRAGESPSKEITGRAGEVFIDVTEQLARPAPWERSVAYATLAAQGDLIPDPKVAQICERAIADIEAAMDGRITETPFAGTGVLRSAADVAAAVAGRLPSDLARQLMVALDKRLTADKGSTAWTDEAHFKLLAAVASSDDEVNASDALDRISRLLAIEPPVLRGAGRNLGPAVRRRPDGVRRIMTSLAQEGNSEAAELLAGWSLTGAPGQAGSRDPSEQSAWLSVLPFAEQAADRLASVPAGTPGSASLLVYFARDAMLVTILDPSDINRALTGLLDVAADHLHLSATRQQALDAASILVAADTGDRMGSQRLSEVFGLACEYARGEHDGSAMDELFSHAHPLSSWRFEMEEATLAGDGLHLAARACRGEEQRITVLNLASVVVCSEPGESALHNVARALSALGSLAGAPASIEIPALTQSPSPSLRAVAAIYWAKNFGAVDAATDPGSGGIELTKDGAPSVRRSMIAQLASVATGTGLSPAGKAAVEAMMHDPLADIRKSARNIHVS